MEKMKPRNLILGAALLSLTAGTAHAQVTTVQPFGNGYVVNTPGHPPTTIQPFGEGAIVNTPGEPPTTIMPFGNGYIVNEPAAPPEPVDEGSTGDSGGEGGEN